MPRHIDPDDLSLLALGEHLEGVEEGHVVACQQCRDELDALRGVVSQARTIEPEDTPVAPPPRVWEAVAAELSIRAGAQPRAEQPTGRLLGRSRTPLLAAAAALVGIVFGAGLTALIAGNDDDGGQVVARTRLAALPDHSGSGEASVVGTGSARVLVLDVSGLTRGSGFYEVWLLDADAQRLVSLGLLDGSTGRFPLPPQVDVAQFPVVDISLEPVDGDPAHSGDSVVRGTLTG